MDALQTKDFILEFQRAAPFSLVTRDLVVHGKPTRLTVITWDYEGSESVAGRSINFIPLWKWLLREDSGKG